MKYEWRKEEKELYLPKKKPMYIEVPEFSYLTINGKGDPNQPEFEERIGALYTAAYTIRMLPKKDIIPDGYFEYTVYPLEGYWTTDQRDDGPLDKSQFVYKVMIRQPEFVTPKLFRQILPMLEKKLSAELIAELKLERITDGPSVQMMHIGSYDSEPASFELMEKYAAENGLTRSSKNHKEIYLSDPRRVAEENRKTVLRFAVDQKV
ncbi:hypothetical protein MFLO_13293 [Listeria floridensis FSL S10-1187]|uniref:GyrI-like small molecule binding domain-containing protein n=1 Tax=Listeria floridensis FSL S10-1187 TaxID=1265817 RepID=A0ABP3AVD4_9LIST|nr:GyrI-like domain-containing protein [Listeria floridensis]EUJ27440.1 hypothetical protein MFLO_13293 [Listeria floridensis FSL S10-1187]